MAGYRRKVSPFSHLPILNIRTIIFLLLTGRRMRFGREIGKSHPNPPGTGSFSNLLLRYAILFIVRCVYLSRALGYRPSSFSVSFFFPAYLQGRGKVSLKESWCGRLHCSSVSFLHETPPWCPGHSLLQFLRQSWCSNAIFSHFGWCSGRSRTNRVSSSFKSLHEIHDQSRGWRPWSRIETGFPTASSSSPATFDRMYSRSYMV